MEEMVRAVRKRFFADVTPKLWALDQELVQQAIAYPARYLDDRGARLPGERYWEILIGIFRDIREHMLAKPRRPAAYLLEAVQRHMQMQGERYLEEAKRVSTAGQLAPGAIARLKLAPDDQVTTALAQVHATLAGRRQRRCKPAAETQQELFKGAAMRQVRKP
jgi:hypothetical protein